MDLQHFIQTSSGLDCLLICGQMMFRFFFFYVKTSPKAGIGSILFIFPLQHDDYHRTYQSNDYDYYRICMKIRCRGLAMHVKSCYYMVTKFI